jgi:hypothetical protein
MYSNRRWLPLIQVFAFLDSQACIKYDAETNNHCV